jgi:hypothetical protein
MNEQYSSTSRTPSAFYDHASWCWRTSQASLLSEVPESLERLPDWGTTADGALFALPTPERLTAARDGFASPGLPTPMASDFRHQGPHAGFTTREKCQAAVDRGFANLPRGAALLPTPTGVEAKVFGPNVDWQLRLSNHAIHIASVLMVKPWLDGNESSDGQHLTQQTIEDCDPDFASG